MIVIPLGIVWGGYTLVWYGYSLIRGPGMGLLDLVLPSRAGKAETAIRNWTTMFSPIQRHPENLRPGTVDDVRGVLDPRGSVSPESSSGTQAIIDIVTGSTPRSQPRFIERY